MPPQKPSMVQVKNHWAMAQGGLAWLSGTQPLSARKQVLLKKTVRKVAVVQQTSSIKGVGCSIHIRRSIHDYICRLQLQTNTRKLLPALPWGPPSIWHVVSCPAAAPTCYTDVLQTECVTRKCNDNKRPQSSLCWAQHKRRASSVYYRGHVSPRSVIMRESNTTHQQVTYTCPWSVWYRCTCAHQQKGSPVSS